MQVAVAVELRALVVETVADLVTDDRADRAEIAGGVGVHAEERRAQDRRWEGDVIHHRVVEGVDGLGGGKPGRRIRGLTQLVDLVVVVEPANRPHVSQQLGTAGGELQAIELAPLLRVPDLRAELTQLHQRLLAGGGGHPLQGGDALAVGLDEVVHQLEHLLLILRREMLGHELLADLLADRALDQAQATLPAGALLRRTAQGAAVELEAPVGELRRQVRRAGVQHPPGRPELPIVQRHAAGQLPDMLDEARLAHDHAFSSRATSSDTGGLEPLLEGEAGRQVRHRHRVVGLIRVAAGHVIPVPLGKLGLEAQDCLSGLRGTLTCVASRQSPLLGEVELQHVRHILAVSGQRFLVLFLPVVGLVRQSQPGLHQVGALGIALGVLGYEVARHAADASAVQLTQLDGQLANIRGGVDPGQVGVQRCEPGGLDALFIHKGGVQSTDLGVGGLGLHDGADVLLRLVAQLVEGAVDGAISGDLVAGQPRSVDVAV